MTHDVFWWALNGVGEFARGKRPTPRSRASS